MNHYQRVLPRDLFNEAKLLKCLGRLALMIENGAFYPLMVRFRHGPDEDDPDAYEDSYVPGFDIRQWPDDGGLYVHNLDFLVVDTVVPLRSSYNSKLQYPLLYEDEGHTCFGEVFYNDGNLALGFMSFLEARAKKEA